LSCGDACAEGSEHNSEKITVRINNLFIQ